MTWLYLFSAALATYRVSLLIAKEDAPYKLAKRFREWKAPWWLKGYWDGFSCPLCVGTQVAILAAGFLCWIGLFPPAHLAFWWLAISGVCVLLHLLDRF